PYCPLFPYTPLFRSTPLPCSLVAAPRVAQSPVAMECRVIQMQQLAGLDGVKVDTWMAFGEIVAVHIAKELLQNGSYDTAAARPRSEEHTSELQSREN